MSSKLELDAGVELGDLQLVVDDVRLVSLTFGVTLYTNELLSDIPEPLLHVYDNFLKICPSDCLSYYSTENMRKHRAISRNALELLPSWLNSKPAEKEYIYLMMKDGVDYRDAPKFKFVVCGSEKTAVSFGKNANLISMAFPAEFGISKLDEMFGFIKDSCGTFPFASGHAGFSLECSEYSDRKSQTHALKMSMLHRGIDISRIPQDARAVGKSGLKTVGWLTMIGEPFVSDLGGPEKIRSQLEKEIDITEINKGLLLQAGLRPLIGKPSDPLGLELYSNVYDLLSPYIDTASEQSPAFSVLVDYVEKTARWYRRLSKSE